MNSVRNAKLTLKELEREISSSKAIALLQDAYDTIETLVEEISEMETLIEDKDRMIADLESEIVDALNGEDM